MAKRTGRDGVFERKDTAGWYASFVDSSGIRRKRRVQAHTRTQALEALSALKAKVQTERVLGVKFSSEMSTVDFMAKYKRHQRTRLKSSTFERLDSVIAALIAKLPALLKDISKAGVAEYIGTRSAEVAPATVRKEIATLKHALGLAVDDWELIHVNPAERVKLPKLSEGRTRYLSPTELRAVLEAAPDWMRTPIALAAFTGMRRGEILNLCWKDVDLPGRRLYLRETKNGTLRIIPLNELAYAVIASLPQGDPGSHVLPGVDGPRLSVYTRRLFAQLGILDASFHSLRHTAASWLVMQGADLYAVGQLLGHRTPRMTQRYSHLSPAYMAETAGKLDAAFQKALVAPDGSGLPRD